MDSPRHPRSLPTTGATAPAVSLPGFSIPPAVGKRLTRVGREFLADFLGSEVQRHPDNRPALTALSQCLAQLDRRLQGLAVDKQLAHVAPQSPIAWYNLACSQALNQDDAGALESLAKAIKLGFADAGFMAQDPDLQSLRPLNSFRKLVRDLDQRQASRPG